MSFKVRQKAKGAEVKIYRHDNPELIGKFGIIQRISLQKKTAYVKLSQEQIEVEVPLADLILP